MIKTADRVLGLGPGLAEGAKRQRGVRGGEIIAQGTPEDVAAEPRSYTGGYLKAMLAKQAPSKQPAAAKRKARQKVAAE